MVGNLQLSDKLRPGSIFLIFLILSSFSFSQKQGNNWYFGQHAGVNFANAVPTVLTNGATTSAQNEEGTATISDTAGNLLFYTDGQSVWNKNNVVMTNGNGLMGNASATQAGVIVPAPGSQDTFYIFTVDDCQHDLANGCRYSIVKMSLSGGLGAVTATKNVLLSPPGVPVAEKITAVKHCNKKDVWVIVHGYGAVYGQDFYAWLITHNGISASPVVSSVGTIHNGSYVAPYAGVGNARGYMKASPNGRKLALAISYDGAPANQDPNVSTTGSFELFDFDNRTGVVSNPVKFGPSANYKGAYGLEFSPGGSILYGATWGNYNSPRSIYQWNLNAGSTAAIQSSATLIASIAAATNPGALQLARNGKIYVVKYDQPNGHLDCINNPNNLGTTCNYQNNAVFLTNNHYGCYGLPTFIQSYFDPGFSYTNDFAGIPTSFKISDTSYIDSVYWTFGDPVSGILNHSKLFNPFHTYNDTGKYNITLILFKCSTADTLKSSIYIYALPVIVFSINDSTQCFPGNMFTFTNTSHITGGTIASYLWKFGDLATDTSKNPSHHYNATGTYKVWLIATSNLGAKDSAFKNVYVYPVPKAGFSVNDTFQCLKRNKFIFTNTSTIASGTMSYNWNWGDGDTTAHKQTNPSHSYLAINNYNIKLVTTSNKGCKDSITKTVYLKASPNAGFSINDSAQCLNGNSFAFTNSSSTPAGLLTYLWHFGDKTNSFLLNPVHQYLLNDTFKVTLIITATNNCVDSIIHRVYVYPAANISFSVNDTDQCLKDNSFIFTNKTTIASGTLTYKWDFGDGNTSNATSPAHTYLNFATFTVKLRSISNNGCTDSAIKNIYVYPSPKASFSINDSIQCFKGNQFVFTNASTIPAGILTYIWSFGDGNNSLLVSPVYKYNKDINFNVQLVAVSSKGCKDTLVKKVYIQPSPVASFTINDSTQCLKGNSMLFRNHSSIDKGTIRSYNWDFGDGFTSKLIDSFTHQYTIFGNIIIKLVATSNLGCKDSMLKTIFIYPMPVAGFNINNPSQCLTGNSFQLTNTTTIPNGTLTYLWSFGDGNTSTQKDEIHNYAAVGTYKVKLVVSSQWGCVDSIIKQVFVNPIPTSKFSHSPGCLEDTTYFSDLSTVGVPDSIISLLWDFGDGFTSNLQNPTHVYTSSGTFSVSLTVTSDNGCPDVLILPVIVNPHVIANSIVTVTVDSEQVVEIFWVPPVSGTVKEYVVERSTDNISFVTIATVPVGNLSYADKSADVSKFSYIYRVKVIDSCGYVGPYSATAKTMVLGYQENTLHPILNWTQYEGWATGVKEYNIELFDESLNEFIYIGSSNTDTNFNDNSTHLNQAAYCYRVIAISNDGTESYSNISCVPTPFDLWVPTAFSPNGDAFNPVFQVFGKYVFEFHIKIYDRWGELVYKSDNIDNTWDGKYKGSLCPTGYYYYQINSEGTKGQRLNTDGMLMLIR